MITVTWRGNGEYTEGEYSVNYPMTDNGMLGAAQLLSTIDRYLNLSLVSTAFDNSHDAVKFKEYRERLMA